MATRTRISITTSPDLQATAASFLSHHLNEDLNCPHAYIGGFAFSLLGNPRATEIRIPKHLPQLPSHSPLLFYDIDVLIDCSNLNLNLPRLRERLENLDKRFASAGLKFYFIREPDESLQGEALVHASKENVLIETLAAGTLGLPTAAEPTYTVHHPSGTSLAILDPPILLLTKMKRWYIQRESTRPQTMSKSRSDKNDLDFLVFWLSENTMKIDFDLYKGKEKPDLLKLVRAYYHDFRDNTQLVGALKGILHEEDWVAIQNAPEEASTSEFVSRLPPEPSPSS